jgi:hypothetical protein
VVGQELLQPGLVGEDVVERGGGDLVERAVVGGEDGDVLGPVQGLDQAGLLDRAVVMASAATIRWTRMKGFLSKTGSARRTGSRNVTRLFRTCYGSGLAPFLVHQFDASNVSTLLRGVLSTTRRHQLTTKPSGSRRRMFS